MLTPLLFDSPRGFRSLAQVDREAAEPQLGGAPLLPRRRPGRRHDWRHGGAAGEGRHHGGGDLPGQAPEGGTAG